MTTVWEPSVRSGETAGLAQAGTRSPSWPGTPPRAWITQMSRSLDFYLALGCEIRSAADGWVLLDHSSTQFVLAQIPAAQTRLRPARWIRLTTPDIQAVRRRMLTLGIPVETTASPGNTAEILVTDPDWYRVVIAEPE